MLANRKWKSKSRKQVTNRCLKCQTGVTVRISILWPESCDLNWKSYLDVIYSDRSKTLDCLQYLVYKQTTSYVRVGRSCATHKETLRRVKLCTVETSAVFDTTLLQTKTCSVQKANALSYECGHMNTFLDIVLLCWSNIWEWTQDRGGRTCQNSKHKNRDTGGWTPVSEC